MKFDAKTMHGVVIAVLLVTLCVVMRVVEHAPNFTPLAATAIFCGFYFRSRLVALAVPLAALVIGDLIGPGIYDWRVMAAVYACLVLPALLGRFVRGKWMPVRLVGASLLASVLFFAVTNFAHFLFTPMYEKSLAGLAECYALALPFFRNTVLGDLAWSCTLFGAWAVLPMVRALVCTNLRRATA